MSKDMPQWLNGYYHRLWENYRNKPFTFPAAVYELKISTKMTTKTLLELEQRGCLTKERSPLDYRSRVYRLVGREEISFAVGLYALVEKGRIEKMTVFEKLALVGDRLPYVITGSHAAYYYHHYLHPPQIVEIKIHLEHTGKWIAFLTDKKTRVFLGDVMEGRRIGCYVKLLDQKNRATDTIRTKTEEGYYIEKSEYLIIELLERQTQTVVIEAIALIITNKKRLSWTGHEGLPYLAKMYGVSRRLGFLLDVINVEAGRAVIKKDVVDQVKKDVSGKVDETFPRDEVIMAKVEELRNKMAHGTLLTDEEQKEIEHLQSYYESYGPVAERWGMFTILPRLTIRKVLEDLGVMYGKKRGKD